MSEIEKYRGIYGDGSPRWARYGHSNHGRHALPILEKWRPASLIDIGCGFNEFARACREKWPIRCEGVDFACPGADIIAPATALPFPDDHCDVLTSFDMLEHLPPDEVDAALAEMARVSRRFIVSISYEDSRNRWQGQTLHPTVRPRDWWVVRLLAAGATGLAFQGRYITGQWSRERLAIAPAARVVLVGNGPSAIERPLGAEVDRFDEVVRFNNFKIAGYEAQLGTRTTLWASVILGIDHARDDAPDRVIAYHECRGRPASARAFHPIPAAFYDLARRHLLDRLWWREGLRDAARQSPIPSSGLLVCAWLLGVVGVERIHLLGFDHFGKTRSSAHHYWMPRPFKQPAEHDPAAEAAYFAQWREAGRVVYL